MCCLCTIMGNPKVKTQSFDNLGLYYLHYTVLLVLRVPLKITSFTMVIIEASNSAITKLLQVSRAHRLDANSSTSNLATFLAQQPSKFESYTPNAEIGAPGTGNSSNNKADPNHGILSVIVGILAAYKTKKDKKMASITGEAHIKEMITSKVRFHGKTPYVHLGVIFDDTIRERLDLDLKSSHWKAYQRHCQTFKKLLLSNF